MKKNVWLLFKAAELEINIGLFTALQEGFVHRAPKHPFVSNPNLFFFKI